MSAKIMPKTLDRGQLNPIDVHVGARIRELRETRGISQRALSEAIGGSSQQSSKYEQGINRISVSILYDIALELGVTVDYFFQGLPGAAPDAGVESRFFAAKGGRQLAEDYLATAPGLRESIVTTATSMANASAALRKRR